MTGGTTRRASTARALTEKDKLLLSIDGAEWDAMRLRILRAIYPLLERSDSVTFEQVRRAAGIESGSRNAQIAKMLIEGEPDMFEVLPRGKIRLVNLRG